MSDTLAPGSFEEAASRLAELSAAGQGVRFSGAGTKLGWGGPTPSEAARLQTSALDRVLAHDPGDLTATFEAGVPLNAAQFELGEHRQMLALDPPESLDGRSATVGGVFATADAGPLQHRYGTPRDLILGMTIALPDGTIARSGSNVIKNVAGYDLPRLIVGSMGTLGLILSVTVRVHHRHDETYTVLGSATDPKQLGDAIAAVNRCPTALDAFDLAWRDGRGGILARCSGPTASLYAAEIAALVDHLGLTEVEIREDDAGLWARQRAGQRSVDRAVLRVTAPRPFLPQLLALADRCEATVVGRAGLGITYLTLNVNQIATIRAGIPEGGSAVVQDLPLSARGAIDSWGVTDGPELALMRAVKAEFDPTSVCNPGVFVDGI